MKLFLTLTIDEYIALPADEKVKVLEGKPDKVLNDLSKLLQLHTISLRDESPRGQEALVTVLGHDDPVARFGAIRPEAWNINRLAIFSNSSFYTPNKNEAV